MQKVHPAIEILESYKNIIWPEINGYLKPEVYPETFRIPGKYFSDVNASYWQILKDYPERKGKYIRGSIVMLVSEAMGAKNEAAVKTAAAMQMSEDWILIHDDFEDNSTTRRGLSTLHRIYGNELAVNAGDALHILMWKVLLDNTILLGEKKAFEVANEFYRMLSRTALGQAVEIDWMQKNKEDMDDEDWYFIADGKTGYYTMAGPARLGGIIGGATENELNALAEFGQSLGRCFQLVDDLLDVTSDFSGMKEKANDIYEGKRTLILGHLLRSVNEADKQKLKNILAKKRDSKTVSEVDWVLGKMTEYGSIDYSWKIAKVLKEQSEKIFDVKMKFLKNERTRKKIKVLMDFILERKH
jgi:geranylgeranyl diphosphate synthase, type II